MVGGKIRALSGEQAGTLADTFRLLGDATRLKIVLACANRPTGVSEIAERLQISLPLTSHHLRLLRAAGLVRAERQGKTVRYLLSDGHIGHMLGDMTDHILDCDKHTG